MSLLAVFVGVFLGSVYGSRVNRCLPRGDARRWLLLVPVWVVGVVVLLTADAHALGLQLVQGLAIGSFAATVGDLVGGAAGRRRRSAGV